MYYEEKFSSIIFHTQKMKLTVPLTAETIIVEPLWGGDLLETGSHYTVQVGPQLTL